MALHHITLAAAGRRTLFRTEDSLRQTVRAISRVAGRRLVLFGLVDEHLHLVPRCSRTRAGRIAQSISLAIRSIVSVPLDPAHIQPVASRAHLVRLVPYILTQAPHHGLPYHPALWTGSCFQDMVGARYVEGLSLQLTVELPRYRLRSALEMVGLPRAPILPARDEDVFRAGASRLVEAAAAAAALGPSALCRSSVGVAARTAVIRVGLSAEIPHTLLARALQVSARTVRRSAFTGASPQTERAIRVRLALEDIVARQPPQKSS